jgi:hypothetical protein
VFFVNFLSKLPKFSVAAQRELWIRQYLSSLNCIICRFVKITTNYYYLRLIKCRCTQTLSVLSLLETLPAGNSHSLGALNCWDTGGPKKRFVGDFLHCNCY